MFILVGATVLGHVPWHRGKAIRTVGGHGATHGESPEFLIGSSEFRVINSDNEAVKVQRIDDTFDWGVDVFKVPLDQIWEVVKFVTNHHKSLSRFRELGNELEVKPPGGCELLKYCDTRFASRITQENTKIAIPNRPLSLFCQNRG